jgi:hypothetical protein
MALGLGRHIISESIAQDRCNMQREENDKLAETKKYQSPKYKQIVA